MFGRSIDVGRLRLQRDNKRVTTTLYRGEGASLDGRLMPDMPEYSDCLESLILALTAAGFPVHTPEFNEAVNTACDAVAHHLVDQPTSLDWEVWEREAATRGYILLLDVSTNKWGVAQWSKNQQLQHMSSLGEHRRRRDALHKLMVYLEIAD
jgi:hypothetical protein